MPKKDYSNWSKEELVREIKKLEKRKKYGIVWDGEHTKEKFEKEAEGHLPVLKEVKNKEIKTDEKKPINILIEGDNYHALSVLNYTHKGAVDVIYIDPPYNTGNGDSFIYNNRIVDENDTYRHSKWLSFMSKRLKLAMNLLSPNGVILISIDDTEFAQLKLLCDEIFGQKNFIANIIWKKKTNPNNVGYIPPIQDYILVYSKTDKPKISELPLSREYIDKKYKNPDNDSRGPWKTSDLSANHKGPYFPIKNPNTGEIYYPPKGRYWVFNEEEVNRRLKEGLIIFGLNDRSAPVQKKFLSEAKLTTLPDTWWDNVALNSEGTEEIANILGHKKFVHPKPKNLIKHILRIIGDSKSIVLDFFAGSGTTGHAVLELNKEDGGNRRFILCTNNENGICTEVCYPRIEKVIKSYKNLNGEKVESLGGNLKYFKTAFVEGESTDKNKKKLVDESTEMLCLGEDCFDEVISGKQFKIFKNNEGKYLGIIYDDDGIGAFKKELKKLNKIINVYVFSLDESAREEEFEDLMDLVNLKPIPEVILNVYRRIFK
jgi:adenine-specific DNA-methyltransferase